jgi:hypothetical protein
MVTVLDGPTYSNATATMKENSKDKISSKEQFKFYQFEKFSSSLKMIFWV